MPIRLFITIDTEEDLWGDYSRSEIHVENVSRIPRLQTLFDRFGAIPTYLVNWPVVTNENACRMIRNIHEKGRCEIGAHCHPWNTPPFAEEISGRNTMLCNLPEELVRKKMENLHEAIIGRFGFAPVCFRAGRWGMGGGAARCIEDLEYKVDSSVTPFIDWSKHEGPDYSEAPALTYRFAPGDFPRESPGGSLLEVPATIGFLQHNFSSCFAVRKRFLRGALSRYHVIGILDRLGVNSFRLLSPETNSSSDMIRLAGNFIRTGHRFLNMFFHSSTLLPGATPFVQNETQLESFLKNIERFLEFASDSGFEYAPLSSALEME